MLRQIFMAMISTGLAWAQQAPITDAERVAAVLRVGDPLVDVALGNELLASGSLDDAIRAVAKAEATERIVRLRALRVVRTLDLAVRVRGPGPRDLFWWLALHEIRREVPEAVTSCLLKRAFVEESVRSSALEELDAASDVARRFCAEWNEVAEAKDVAKHEALEAELKTAGPAAVPPLLSILGVPPEIAFAAEGQSPIDARQQVRAILGLATVLECEKALPFFVMHANGPSLTQSTHAAMSVQRFSGEHFGAAFLTPGDDVALLAWWKKHKAEHHVVLDYLNHRTLQWARSALEQGESPPANIASYAIASLDRAGGEQREPPRDLDAAGLRARLDAIEAAWVLAPR